MKAGSGCQRVTQPVWDTATGSRPDKERQLSFIPNIYCIISSIHSVTRDLPDRGVEPLAHRDGLAVSRVRTGLEILALVPGNLSSSTLVS